MNTLTKTGFTSAVAAGLLIAMGPGLAQQSQLSEQDVKSFFDEAEKGMVEAVRSGDYGRVLDWTERHIADGATFSMTNEVYAGDDRKSFAAATLDKQDMLRLSRIAVGVMSGMKGQPVKDYSLNIEVGDIVPAGSGAATVATRITESGKLSMSQGKGGGQGSKAEPVELRATATCHHLVQRADGGDGLVIGLTTCEARTEL